jgi:4-carboxymuconolactone decarboxylase
MSARTVWSGYMTPGRSPGSDGRLGSSGANDVENRLRRLASSDLSFGSGLDASMARVPAPGLDDKTDALIRLAAFISIGASLASYRSSIEATRAAGATPEEVVTTLIAVAPTVGLCRVVSAAPSIAVALGYDIDAALEHLDMPLNRWSPDGARDDGS